MLSHSFPYNHVLHSMKYHNDTLDIYFKKPKGLLECRSYNTKKEIAYKLFYCLSAEQVLSFYSNEIKNKCQLLTIKR